MKNDAKNASAPQKEQQQEKLTLEQVNGAQMGSTLSTKVTDLVLGVNAAEGDELSSGILAQATSTAGGQPVYYDNEAEKPISRAVAVCEDEIDSVTDESVRIRLKWLRKLASAAHAHIKIWEDNKDGESFKRWKIEPAIRIVKLPEYVDYVPPMGKAPAVPAHWTDEFEAEQI